MNPWQKGALCLTIGLTVAVLARLGATGLIKVYRLLFCYLALDLISSIVAVWVPNNTTNYAYYYFSAQSLKIVIASFMLMEIYGAALEATPALAQFGRNGVGYILAGAALFPLSLLWLDRGLRSGKHPYLRTFFLFEQTMDGTVAIFLILIFLFIAWFPVRMRRNVVVYMGGFIVWMLSRSTVMHFINQSFTNPQARLAGNIVEICIVTGCLVFWLAGFRRHGELRTAVVGHIWNRAEAERLTEQLNAINDGIARLRRK